MRINPRSHSPKAEYKHQPVFSFLVAQAKQEYSFSKCALVGVASVQYRAS